MLNLGYGDLFEGQTFDIVVVTRVMHHLTADSHETALHAISRVLKPGGVLWLQTSTPEQVMLG